MTYSNQVYFPYTVYCSTEIVYQNVYNNAYPFNHEMKSVIAAVIVVVLVAAGVGGYFLYNSMQSNGNIAISVADANTLQQVDAVYITFGSVALHSNGGNNSSGWMNYSVLTKTVNILGLTTSNASLLSNITLHAGKYTMIRLYITNVTVNILGVNYTFTLSAPYAFINRPFTVSAHSTTNVIIDFNLNSDLNLNSKIFTPYVGVA